MNTFFQERILNLIRYCNRSEGRIDFHLESRAPEFGLTKFQFKFALEGMRHRLTSLTFDPYGYAIVIRRGF